MTKLAMDIGASKTLLRCIQDDEVLFEKRISYEGAAPASMLLGQIRDIVRETSQVFGKFERLAIASAPTIDQQGRVACWPNRPDWVDQNIVTTLSPFVSEAIIWCDDGVAGTLADASLNPAENLMHLALGSGVGGSLWIDRKVMFNPEFGHMQIVPGGNQCVCGQRGCLQAYVSGFALDAVGCPASGPEYEAWVHTATNVLAMFIEDMSSRFHLSRISLSGGFLKRIPDLTVRCREALELRSRDASLPLRVELSQWPGNAPLKGAEFLTSIGLVKKTVDSCAAQFIFM